MSVTLYRKYRPQRWTDIAGQNHVKVTLAFEIATGKTAHAYIFSGPRGVGKTTTARIFAKAINCDSLGKEGEPCGKCPSCEAFGDSATLDIIEIDAASHRGIDAVRENIIENARFSPSRLRRKVFIIDEVHMLTTEAFNALLKTLEEPPSDVVFILATTELHKVPATIVSRCQRFDFRKIPFTDIVERLHGICEDEKCKVDVKVLQEIARHAEGCLRDAEGLLGKILAVGDGKRVSYDEALVVLPRSDFALAAQYVEALLRQDARTAVQTVGDCLEEGVDLDQFATDVIELMRKVLLTRLSGNPDVFSFDLDEDRKQRLAEWAQLASTPHVVHAVETLLDKRRDMKAARPPQLPLELAAVIVCEGLSERSSVPAQERPARVPAGAAQDAPGRADRRPEERRHPDPATAPAKAEAAKPEPTEPVIEVSRIKEVWSECIRRVGQVSHSLTFLLGVADPLEVVGRKLRIGFEFPFHRDKLNQDKTRMTVEQTLLEMFGEELLVEGVLLEKKERVVHDDAAEGDQPAGQASGMAQNLASAFGGRVIE